MTMQAVQEQQINGRIVLAIDPGPTTSGWCRLKWNGMHRPVLLNHGEVDHQEGMDLIRKYKCEVAIEGMQNYGMQVGNDVFETLKYIGKLLLTVEQEGRPFAEILRPSIKANICGTPASKDKDVRLALISRFCRWYGLEEKQVKGLKASPGPLYGVSKHVWSALALAITYFEVPRS